MSIEAVKTRLAGWFSMEHFDWHRIDKLTSVTLIKLMASYIAITATATQSISFLELWGLTKVELPFNWQLLFWGSLSYAIGYVLYIFGCPSFIKEYPDFQAIRASSWIIDDYVDELELMKSKGISLASFEGEHQKIIDCLNGLAVFPSEDSSCLKSINEYAVASKGSNRGNIEKSKELYNIISHGLSISSKKLSLVTSVFIYVSFLVLLWVVLTNISTAMRYLLF